MSSSLADVLRTIARPTLVAAMLAACGGESKGGAGPVAGGSLRVTVSGLPGGAAARVDVTGPGAYAAALNTSGRLDGLAEGVYRIAAGYVNAAGQTWTATPAPDSVFVAVDDTVAVAVAYTGQPTPTLNLTVAGTQLIQSTQRPDGSVPMIVGRDALLRVFVVASTANSARPAVRVRLLQGGAPVDSLDVAAPAGSVPLAVDSASLGASWNVLIPGARVGAGMSYQVVVDPADLVPETAEGDNRWPGGSGSQAVAVQAVPALAVRFVPVRQTVNNLTGQVNSGNTAAFIDVTRRMLPLGAVTTSLRATYNTDAPVYQSNDANGGWGQTLAEVNALRATDGSSAHYVGVIQVTYGGGIAGMGYIGWPASLSWDKASSAPGVIAHELGHNFGRNHAPCGNPSGPDPGYPYANASTGTWGIDLAALTLKSPGTHKDLMSYCDPDWISDYNYLAILAFRGTAALRPAARTVGTVGRGLLVWGRVLAGRVILEPSFVVNAPATLPARPGPHTVEGLDATGLPLFRLAFEGEAVPDFPRGEERHFAFVVPLSATEESRLASLRLVGHGLTAIRGGAGAALRAPSRVVVDRRGGEVVARWDASHPMALVRDAATGEVLSFARGGRVGLTAGGPAVRVELSDGVRTLQEVTVVRP